MSKLYVAYGSNLNKRQMEYRCPTAVYVGAGELQDYELQFKGSVRGAHATIAPKEGSSVPVGVWMIQKADERRLDLYEGVPSYYFKKNIHVQMGGETVRGMVYIMDQKHDFGLPTRNYYETVREGYQNCGLDTAVLDKALQDSMEQAQPRLEAEQGMRFY